MENITKLFTSILNVLKEFFYWVVNTIIDIIIFFLDLVFHLLPENFFHIESFSNNTYNIISTLNWVFPVDTAVSCVGMVVMAITLKASVGWALRWVKAVE